MSVPKGRRLETSRLELSEDMSFGIGTFLFVEESIALGKPPQGVWYTPSYTAGYFALRGTWVMYHPII